MLEVKWKEKIQLKIFYMHYSFNPCYVGSKMESVDHPNDRLIDDKFQSLLCWK